MPNCDFCLTNKLQLYSSIHTSIHAKPYITCIRVLLYCMYNTNTSYIYVQHTLLITRFVVFLGNPYNQSNQTPDDLNYHNVRTFPGNNTKLINSFDLISLMHANQGGQGFGHRGFGQGFGHARNALHETSFGRPKLPETAQNYKS